MTERPPRCEAARSALEELYARRGVGPSARPSLRLDFWSVHHGVLPDAAAGKTPEECVRSCEDKWLAFVVLETPPTYSGMKIDDAHATAAGEVLIRPWDVDGKPLSDPLSIFESRDAARAFEVLPDGSIDLRANLVVNGGRQAIANLIGGRNYDPVTPNSDWIVKKVRFGTYDQAPRFSDVTLSPQPQDGVFTGGENTIDLDGGGTYDKLVSSVDWPQPFLVRFEIVLGTAEANGQLIREMGLYCGNGQLFARKTFVGINKAPSFGLTILWRVRT